MSKGREATSMSLKANPRQEFSDDSRWPESASGRNKGSVLAVLLCTLLAAGCVPKIPGGDRSYGIKSYRNQELRAMNARFDYGRFKGEPLGAASRIGSFRDFHILTFHWNRPDGTQANHQVDIGALIEQLKERQRDWFPSGWAEIEMRYEKPMLRIDLSVTERVPSMKDHKYGLYEFEMR